MKKIRINLQQLLHKKQEEAYKALSRFNVIVAGRRFGKTRLGAFKIFISSIQREGVYWWVSPTTNVGNSAWRVVRKLCISTFGVGIVKINETTRTINLPNGSIIEFKSADNPDSLRGEGLRGVVLDECAQIKEGVWSESLRASLSDKKGWAIFIGTPKGQNWFWKIFKKAEKGEFGWKAFTFTTYDNPLVDPHEIDEARKDLSERVFNQEYMAEFLSDTGLVFKREWFKERLDEPEYIARFFSWDTASSIGDASAYTCGIVGELMPDYRLFIREVFREKLEFPQLQYRIEEVHNKYSSETRGIIIENKSSGISVIQSLRQTLNPEIANLLVAFNPKGSKEERASQASKWCEKGCIVLPIYSDKYKWLYNFEDELLTFPNSEFKDQTDAFSQLLDYVSNYLQQGLEYR